MLGEGGKEPLKLWQVLPFREDSGDLLGLCSRRLERWAPGLALSCPLGGLGLLTAPLCLISARSTQPLTLPIVRITLIAGTPCLGALLWHLASSWLVWAGAP